MKKKLLIALSYVLIVALTIAGTVAYLNMKTEEVQNTFNLSDDVIITLTEADVNKVDDEYIADEEGKRVLTNTYDDIYPGAVLPKDPTVFVDDESADLYTRAVVTIPNGQKWLGLLDSDLETAFAMLTNNTQGADWKLIEAEADAESDAVVYTFMYSKRLKAGEETTAIFEELVIPSSFTIDELKTLIEGGTDIDGDGAADEFNVNIYAEALQAAGFESAEAAFAAYDAE